MPGVSREQIEHAKEIELLSYLQAYEPDAVKKISANEYCLKNHDSFKISNGKWNWFSRGIGGKNALTFLIKVRGMDFVDAVRMLCDGHCPPVSYSQPIKPLILPKQKPSFALPPPYSDNSRITAYLLNRGIDREIINRCIEMKILYESRKYHNCVFVGRDADNHPRFACVRSIANNFRQDIDRSDKRYGFCLPPASPDARFVMIAEAPIDVLSLATIHKMDAGMRDGYHYLSLGGTSTLAFMQFLTDHPEIGHVILCLDNDAAGRKCMEKIKAAVHEEETLKNRHISVITELPPEGKDFNDTLLAMIQKHKEETMQNPKKEAPTLL